MAISSYQVKVPFFTRYKTSSVIVSVSEITACSPKQDGCMIDFHAGENMRSNCF